jgi:uncharacterized protein (TIGR02271 family)
MSETTGQPIGALTKDDIPQLRNLPVYANGEEIGHVGDIYYDEDTERVECVGIAGDGIGFKRNWLPAQGAVLQDDGLHLAFGSDRFEGAPSWDDDADLDEDRYRELRGHYGGEGDVTRHEEELRVGTEERPAGSVRLRKWVETEPVSTEVELERETAHVVREPVDQPVARDTDAAFGDEEIEVPLRAEEAVVGKRTVAKERVGIEKDVDTRTETVRDEVRKEHVDVDDDAGLQR